ncbi:hypothetical protein [Micromonospora sp. NPDC048839]|uniref:hypothetical protein n=1 Tax=Micromonospora sp. NPDC048839 TaxID=3155641 RepID=UPI0033DFC134
MSKKTEEPVTLPPLTDILVVGFLREAQEYPAFGQRHVFSVLSQNALYGRRFRRAYFTTEAANHPRWPHFQSLLLAFAARSGPGAEVKHISYYDQDQAADAAAYAGAGG